MSTTSPNNLLWWIIPDVLAGMSMPFIHLERRLNQTALLSGYDDDLSILYSSGIRAVVSLLNIPSDSTVYTSAGFDFLCLPIPDGFAPTMEQAEEFVNFVEKRRAEKRAVAVHCEAGLGRTGTMLALYLIRQGEKVEIAISKVRSIEKAAIETMHQIQFLEEFAKAGN